MRVNDMAPPDVFRDMLTFWAAGPFDVLDVLHVICWRLVGDGHRAREGSIKSVSKSHVVFGGVVGEEQRW